LKVYKLLMIYLVNHIRAMGLLFLFAQQQKINRTLLHLIVNIKKLINYYISPEKKHDELTTHEVYGRSVKPGLYGIDREIFEKA